MAITRKKFRTVDFDHDEFCNHLDIKKGTFPNKFKRFTAFYKMDKKKFKFEADENGKFFWPAEWAEVAGVLIKFIQENPCARKIFDKDKITSKEICNYYREITEYVEKEMPSCFQNLIKSLPSYYAAKALPIKIPILEQKIAEIIAYHTLYEKKKHGVGRNVDILISVLSEKLDREMFEMYKSDYSFFCAIEANKKKLLHMPDPRKNNTVKLPPYVENIDYVSGMLPLDFAIAEILKQLVERTSYMNTWDNDCKLEWENKLREKCKAINCGMNEQEILNFVEELKVSREKYYEFMSKIYPKRDSGMYGLCAKLDELMDKTNPKTQKEMAIERLEMLREKQPSEDWDKRYHEEIEEQVLSGYIKFSDDITEEAKKYEGIVQIFVGQMLLPYIGEDL